MSVEIAETKLAALREATGKLREANDLSEVRNTFEAYAEADQALKKVIQNPDAASALANHYSPVPDPK